MMKTTGSASCFLEIARCKMLGRTWQGAFDLAKHTLGFRKDVVGALEKAAVGGGSLGDLSQNTDFRSALESYHESLRSRCAFLTIAGMAPEVPLRTQIFFATLPIEGTAPAENSTRPVTKIQLSGTGLEPREASCTIVVSNEALTLGSAKELLKKELDGGSIAALDGEFLSACFDELGSALDSGTDDVSADIRTMLTTVATTGAENLFLIISPATANSLCTAVDSDGLALYPDLSPQGGTLFGIPTIVSGSLPTGDSTGENVLLVDGASMVWGMEGVELKSTDAGMIDMSDEPEGTSLISLFQADLTALKSITHFGFEFIRPNAFTGLSGCNW
jgi:HK97 family phage major capsid protein